MLGVKPLKSKRQLGFVATASGGAALAVSAILSACGGGGSAENPTQTDTNPDATPGNTPVITATPFETPEVTPIPTAEPTEAPKLYGPSLSSGEELLAIVQTAYGGEMHPQVQKNTRTCIEGNEEFSFESTNNERDALNLLSYCNGIGDKMHKEATGSIEDINKAIDELRNAYFYGVERFIARGVLSESYLSQGSVQRVIDLYYKHIDK